MNRKERRTKNKEVNVLDETVKIIRQYFPDLLNQFEGLTDKRHQSYVEYKMKVIFVTRILGLMCAIKSMNELSRDLNTDEAIMNIGKTCGLELEEIPHHDTINNVFENINVEELERINRYIVNSLIRGKILDKYRIRERYFHIIVDATGLATSRIKYNENCLVKEKTDKNGNKYKEYSTYVLEAKLVVGEMVFSIGTEFVENKEDIEKLSQKGNEKAKQDCEINAFKRLVKKIKKSFPRLNIVISGDALYANSSVIDICKEYNWKYIIRFKEGSIPTLYKDFTSAVTIGNESTKEDYGVISDIEYNDYKINVIRYIERAEVKAKEKEAKRKYKRKKTTKKMVENKDTEFVYITNLSVSDNNVETTIKLGRKRWKIENEGFNIQKNGTFNIGHLYSKNQTAIKVHYLLIQMTHTIMQLIENGSIKVRELKLLTVELSQKIKDSLTKMILNLEVHNKVQLRFTD